MVGSPTMKDVIVRLRSEVLDMTYCRKYVVRLTDPVNGEWYTFEYTYGEAHALCDWPSEVHMTLTAHAINKLAEEWPTDAR